MFDKLKDKAGSLTESAKKVAKDSAEKVSERLGEDAGSLKSKVTSSLSEMSGKVSEYVPDEVSSKVGDIAGGIKDSAEGVGNKAGEFFDSHLEGIDSYCSWCFTKSGCTSKEKNNLSRNVYICDNCGHEVVKCRACNNKAKSGNGWGWDSQFCAVHDGSIAKFETLNSRLENIDEYRAILARSDVNYKKIGTTAAFTLGGAAVIAPLAFMAAPAVGGALGTSLLGYSGAAATNAGLATLGGGALAAGGAGMAGGVAVVTAAGGALGGRYGAVISNSYYGDIQGFDVSRIQSGDGPAVVCIDGFLTQDDKDAPVVWLNALSEHYPNNEIYYVEWESKRLRDIGATFGVSAGKAIGMGAIKKFASSASKVAAKKLAPLSGVFQVLNLASNPWSVAGVKAFQTGALLADLISRTDKEYILIGHSLGARVIYSCLAALKTKQEKYIRDVHLLGGAVSNFYSDSSDDKVNWNGVQEAVSGTINNYYSNNDEVLRFLYKTGEALKFDFGDPIGRGPIANADVINVDVSNCVGGHSEYKRNIQVFMNGN